MNVKFKIVTSPAELSDLTVACPPTAVADVETRGTEPHLAGLLGLAFTWAGAPQALYVQFNEWDSVAGVLKPTHSEELVTAVRAFLAGRQLIGHNIEYDRKWIDTCFDMKTTWHADTRILWHLSDRLQIQRGYGLKTAQKMLLGWKSANDEELARAVKAAGGSLKKGDHYLAPTYLLAKYAALDVEATLQLYNKVSPFFDANDYWEFAHWIKDYGAFLEQWTQAGVLADQDGLTKAATFFEGQLGRIGAEVQRLCSAEIADIEADWRIEDARVYKKPEGRYRFLMGLPGAKKQRKFNFNSPQQLGKLLYEKLKLPVLELTETGRPKVARPVIQQLQHPVRDALVEYSEVADCLEKAKGYVEAVKDGLIHFPLNWAAVVSGRLSGFKPYCLNMPFDVEQIMRCFRLPEGHTGIHADFTSVEPCVIAALSEDETLLKVFRDGLGDVYLDLALVVFPHDRELHAGYDPNIPCTEDVKARFKSQRKAAKIAKLAMDYTGTEYTIARSLTAAGFPTTEEEALYIVNRHNELFWKVKALEEKLKNLHEERGYIRNIWGRIIYVPREYRKDTLNRVVQSSAHDTLIAWVKEIADTALTRGVIMKPVLPDIHDSTSWCGPEQSFPAMKAVFVDALRNVNERLALPVTIKAEIKQFTTFYGLKNRE